VWQHVAAARVGAAVAGYGVSRHVYYSPDYVRASHAFETTRKAAWIADSFMLAGGYCGGRDRAALVDLHRLTLEVAARALNGIRIPSTRSRVSCRVIRSLNGNPIAFGAHASEFEIRECTRPSR